ncbi:hypothetical protein HC928_16495, partial [bacterium]|nr:hypothetical protein [bacterium]
MSAYSPELRCITCGGSVTLTAWRCEACARRDPADIDAGLIEIANPRSFDADAINNAEWSLWRYAAMLPFERRVSLGEGLTPLTSTPITFNDVVYDVAVKLDFLQPTSSYKDRGTVGVINWLAAQASRRWWKPHRAMQARPWPAYASAAGMQSRIFVPQNAP